jgi:Zn finger protein HypA/HybF involved in hydrogenase expression
MADIIDFNSRRTEPHLSGKARCLTCKHEWVAVVPVGVTTMLCPSCGHDGHMLGEVVTHDEQWQCHCGWSLFRIDRGGVYCPQCGDYQTGWFK